VITGESASGRRVHRLELAISYLLRAGVICSLLLVLIGIAATAAQHPGWANGTVTMREVLSSGRSPFTSWSEVLAGVLSGNGLAIVMLGLLVLVGTPVMRVALSIGLFAYQKDRVFVMITTVVLLLLMLSFVLGRGGV
jgi:uncharacterized membrane protein